MVFSSIFFLFTFLTITLLLYYAVPNQMKNVVLLIVSLIFYAWGEPIYVFLMILSILINYVSGLEIEKKRSLGEEYKSSLIFAVAVNLGLLFFFKYYTFLIGSLNSILPFQIPCYDLPLPIGISFYTFQILSYIVDVYKGKVKAQKNIVSFAVYVTMFPQLIAGPIVQYSDVDEQLKHRKCSMAKLGEGALLFIRGLGKKVLLANTIGMIFTKISGLEFSDVSAVTAWIGCIAYTFQIYFDFSGYSDMAIGLGKMFGFQFNKNFDYPYISRSVTEFWRRWHISLGSWFREYVYIPLGGNRVDRNTHIRNIMIVWCLTGLWHGASWNFVVWGLYYGLILLAEKFLWGKWIAKLPKAVGICYNMFFVMTGWVFFFSPTLKYAVQYLAAMFGFGAYTFMDTRAVYLLLSNGIFLVIAGLCCTPMVFKKFENIHKKRLGRQMRFQLISHFLIFFLSIAYLVTETYNPFLYFRF